jgi:hypothetical protein
LLPVLNAPRYSMSAALRASSSRKIASKRGSYVTVRPTTRGDVQAGADYSACPCLSSDQMPSATRFRSSASTALLS